MAGRTVGSVSVTVVPDAAAFSTLLRAQIVPQANSLGQGIGEALQRQIAASIRQGIIDGGVTGLTPAGAAGAKAGDVYGGEFDRMVRTRIDAALRSIPPVSIGVSTSEADQKIKDIAVELNALRDQRIGVDIGSAEALAKIQQLRDRLLEVATTAPNIQVKADAQAALDRLQEILLKADEVGAKTPTIKVDVDDAGAKAKLAEDAAAADAAGSSFSGLLVSGVALGPALIPVIAAVTGAVLGLASVIGAVGAGIGVIGLAFSGVRKALTDLNGEQQRQSTQAASAGRAATSNAASQASALASIANAEESLKNTRANAADAAVRAAENVKNAKTAEAKAEKDAAQATQDATAKVAAARQQLADDLQTEARAIATAEAEQATAERGLADAQQSATDAQVALTEARKTAQQQMEDLNNQVIDGANAQRQAVFDVADAQRNLTNLTAPGSIATDEQKAQAQLAYDEAIQRQKELQTAQDRLVEKQKESNQAGIDGAAIVVAAQKGVTDANQRVIDAQDAVAKSAQNVVDVQSAGAKQQQKDQQAIADAVTNVVKIQQDGATKVLAAQQRVTDAIREQATQARQSAFSIQQGLQSIAAAQRSLAAAQSSGGGGGAGSAGTFDKYAADLATLSPAVIAFAKFIKETLQPNLKDLQGAAAEGLLPGVQAGIETLLPFMPSIHDFIKNLAGVMGDLFLQASKALASPFWRQFGDFIGREAGPTLSTFAKIIGNIALGVAGILQAFDPVTQKIGGGILGMSQSFADFGKKAGDPDSPFQKFIRYVQEEGPKVVDTFGHIFRAIGGFAEGLAPYGDLVLAWIDKIAKFIGQLSPGTIGGIVTSIGGLFLVFQGFKASSKLVEGATSMLSLFGAQGAKVAAAGGPIVLAIAVVAALGVVMFELYQHNKTVHDYIDQNILPIFHEVADYFTSTVLPILKKIGDEALKGIEKGFGYVKKAVEDNKEPLSKIVDLFGAIVNMVVTQLLPTLGPVLQAGFTVAGLLIANLVTAIGTVVTAIELVVAAAQGKWDLVHQYFSSGIRGIVGLINDFIDAINSIPGIPNIPLIPVPAQYTAGTSTTSGAPNATNPNRPGPGHPVARGGVFPGYAPGVDSIPARVSPGEAVLVPELVRYLGPDWVYRMNSWASGGRAATPGVQHFGIGGIVSGIGGGVSDFVSGVTNVVGGVTKFVLGPAEAAAISGAEHVAQTAINHIFPPGIFRGMANFAVDQIGNSFKFADGGVMPGDGFSMPTGLGIGAAGAMTFNTQGGHTYQLAVHNNRRDISGPEVVTAFNQMHAIHGDPLLMGG